MRLGWRAAVCADSQSLAPTVSPSWLVAAVFGLDAPLSAGPTTLGILVR
jgi:hypothetical protein